MNTAKAITTARQRKVEISRITEIISSSTQASSVLLLAPFLQSMNLQDENRWLIFINPPHTLEKNTLQKWGVDPTSILVLHANQGNDAVTLTQRALANGKGHTVVSWLDNTQKYQLPQLEHAALAGHSQGILIRQR